MHEERRVGLGRESQSLSRQCAAVSATSAVNRLVRGDARFTAERLVQGTCVLPPRTRSTQKCMGKTHRAWTRELVVEQAMLRGLCDFRGESARARRQDALALMSVAKSAVRRTSHTEKNAYVLTPKNAESAEIPGNTT